MTTRALLLAGLLCACSIPSKVALDGSVPDAADGDGGLGDGAPGGDGGAAPVITITDEPAAIGNQTDVTFTYDVDVASATVTCRLDADAYASCPPPSKTFTGLAGGTHTFDIQATANGQTGTAPTYTFTIDVTPPTLVLTGQPADPSASATAELQFTTGDATTVTCALDAGAAAPCTSPKTYGGLADGAHTFTLAGTDDAGNTATRTYTWTVDTSGPSVAITQEPSSPSPSSTATFQFTTGGATTVTCALDAGAPAACTSPKTYGGLADGSHTFTLAGTDASGNTTTRTYTWIVDTTPPVVAITSQPPSLTMSATATFQFTTGDATTVTCSLDGQGASACTSPKTYNSLGDGAHTFAVTGGDAAGNVATRTYAWTVDTTPPVLAITSGPSMTTSATGATFAFTVGDSVTVTCALDGATPAACASPKAYSGLAEGAHTFALRGTDTAGNTATKTYAWTVDTTPPVVAITTPPTGPTRSTSVSIPFTTGDATTVTCALDGGAPVACTSPAAYSGLADGSHTFAVHGTDAAGNTGTATATWTVDTTPPVLAITSSPPASSRSTSASFAFTVGDAVTVTCSIDGTSPAPCTSPWSYTGLAQGSHSFTLSGTDAAGNTATVTFTWAIDTVAPVVTIGSKPPSLDTNKSPTFTFSTTEGTPACSIDLAPSTGCTSPKTFGPLGDGGHSLVVSATDAAGNYGSAGYSWTIDATPPAVSLSTMHCDTTSSWSVTWSASDATSGLVSGTCSYAGNSWDCFSARGYASNFIGSTGTFKVTYTDAAGNVTSKSTAINFIACQ